MSVVPLQPVPILGAVADALLGADDDQVPMDTLAVFARARRGLAGVQVTDDELRDAACTLVSIGVLHRYGEQWSRGPCPRAATMITTRLELTWWSARAERERGGWRA